MKQRYIILGNKNEASIQSSPFFSSMAIEEPLGLALSIEELDDADLAGANKDPAVHSLAPAEMPLTLVTPFESTAEASGSTPWGVLAVGADSSPRTGRGIRVAMLDSGLQREHPAFAALLAENKIVAYNFTAGAADDVTDIIGHGTHCAGTIAGGTVGTQRIGIAPGIDRLLVGKVLGDGGGTNETVLAAIQWAARQGAHIVSMSLGIDFPRMVERLHTERDMPLQAATSMALKAYRDTVSLFGKLADFLSLQNVLLAAATGNESRRPAYTIDVAPPAASENFVKIGAIAKLADGSFGVAGFSNTGPDIVAPGADIVSASIGGGLLPMSGTSMATPHVAGVAALWAERLLEQNGEVSFQNLKTELLAAAQRLEGRQLDLGRGLVRAPQA